MKFGHTLYHGVIDEWHPYSVDYKGMKKVLKGKQPGLPGSSDDHYADVHHDVQHDEATISTTPQKKIDTSEFFRVYENSKRRIRLFYADRERKAQDHMTTLEQRMERGESIRKLWVSIASFEGELDVLIEFLQLNKTGFSKILKKYDKCVGTSVRDEKFAELMTTHEFLDGMSLLQIKERLEALRETVLQLEDVQCLEQQEEMHHDDEKLARPDKKNKKESDQYQGHVDRIAELLKVHESNSPFFANNKARTLPTFKPSEIYRGEILGQGEFGTVREIQEFRVPESCHICFLHRVCVNATVTPDPSSFLPSSNTDEEAKEHGSSEERENNSIRNNDHVNTVSKESTVSSNKSVSFSLPSYSPYPKVAGSFRSEISAITGVSDTEELEDDHDDEDLRDTRGFMKDHCLREGSARYAIKQLRDDLSDDMREAAALDIAFEAKVLAVLSHPNIVKLRGTCYKPGHPSFFLVMDRLYDTLGEKCESWKKVDRNARGFLGFFVKDKNMLEDLWVERLMATFDVARAMSYIHSHNIVFRDLKPENVGFDVRGDAKIFDFGLAKDLQPWEQVGPDQYRASGMTGSRRYMAPEVALCKHYGLSADVYSFAILTWEVLSLKHSYKGYGYEKHANLVVLHGKRPKIPHSWPALLKKLIAGAWSPEPALRPSFSQIRDQIKGELSIHQQDCTFSERSVSLLNKSDSSIRPRTARTADLLDRSETSRHRARSVSFMEKPESFISKK